MEYKVGEIFELNGKKYQVIEDNDGLFCENCCFKSSVIDIIGECYASKRKDNNDVCFELVEE